MHGPTRHGGEVVASRQQIHEKIASMKWRVVGLNEIIKERSDATADEKKAAAQVLGWLRVLDEMNEQKKVN